MSYLNDECSVCALDYKNNNIPKIDEGTPQAIAIKKSFCLSPRACVPEACSNNNIAVSFDEEKKSEELEAEQGFLEVDVKGENVGEFDGKAQMGVTYEFEVELASELSGSVDRDDKDVHCSPSLKTDNVENTLREDMDDENVFEEELPKQSSLEKASIVCSDQSCQNESFLVSESDAELVPTFLDVNSQGVNCIESFIRDQRRAAAIFSDKFNEGEHAHEKEVQTSKKYISKKEVGGGTESGNKSELCIHVHVGSSAPMKSSLKRRSSDVTPVPAKVPNTGKSVSFSKDVPVEGVPQNEVLREAQRGNFRMQFVEVDEESQHWGIRDTHQVYLCDECHEVHVSSDEVKAHYATAHEDLYNLAVETFPEEMKEPMTLILPFALEEYLLLDHLELKLRHPRVYKCKECYVLSSSPDIVKDHVVRMHMIIVPGVRRFICELCGFNAGKSHFKLKQHFWSSHRMTVDKANQAMSRFFQ